MHIEYDMQELEFRIKKSWDTPLKHVDIQVLWVRNKNLDY